MHPHADVDPVEERPRDPPEIASTGLRWTGADAVRRAVLTARAGVRGEDQLEGGRERRAAVRTMHGDHAGFEWLTQRVEDVGAELRRFGKES